MKEQLNPWFEDFTVNVVQCPDLRNSPYYLPAPGKKSKSKFKHFKYF